MINGFMTGAGFETRLGHSIKRKKKSKIIKTVLRLTSKAPIRRNNKQYYLHNNTF